MSEKLHIRLEPLALEIEVPRRTLLSSSFAQIGMELPCGGTTQCGGCRIRVREGTLAVTAEDRGIFTEDDLRNGWRLGCKARAETSLVLECAQWQMEILTDNSTLTAQGKSGYGVAIDLGTTTIVAQMIDMATGKMLAVETALNPQASFGADVMRRIQAALDGEDLTTPLRAAVGEMIATLGMAAGQTPIREVLLVGNTVMHHLFSCLAVAPLAQVPFTSPSLGQQVFKPSNLGWNLPADCTVRFAPCIGGFVGSDILAGIVATGMAHRKELTALIDLGTNGEIAIGNQDGIVCASTAAGPAFEAGTIRMGMRAATGAISHVSLVHGQMEATVIGDVEPRGICGSGLVDAVAVGLRTGAILRSGRIVDGSKQLRVSGSVILFQTDIRELQLAKAAIGSGIKLLLKRLCASIKDVNGIHLAGAFGNYVALDSALDIGMIDAARERMHAAGNTALRGAKMLLMSTQDPVLPPITHVSLAAEVGFQGEYADCITFRPADLIETGID